MGGQISTRSLVFSSVLAGSQIRPHDGTPNGRLRGYDLELTLTITAAAGTTFTFKPGGVALNNDDFDLITNALISSLTHRYDKSSEPMISSLSLAKWRTMVQAIVKRDVQSSLADGAALANGVATTCVFRIPIPYRLREILDDGSLYEQGSIRVREGQTEVNVLASSTAATALKSGTNAALALTGMALIPVMRQTPGDQGAPYYVGPDLKIIDEQSIGKTGGIFSNGTRILPLEYNNLAAAYTSQDVQVRAPGVDVNNMSPSQLNAGYKQINDLTVNSSAPDVTLRATPLLYPEPGSVSSDLPPPDAAAPVIQYPSSGSTLSVLSLVRKGISSGAVSAVKAVVPDSKIDAKVPRSAFGGNINAHSAGILVKPK